MRRCKHGWHGDDLVFMRTTQPWAWGNAYKVVNCASTACRSVTSSVNNWTETHYQLEKQRKKLFQEIRSLCSRTCWRTSNSVSNTVLSLNVFGNWSREFQPLCFPDLDSPDSQSHVLGYSHWTKWEGSGTWSHFGPRPLRKSWLTFCCCIAVIACGIGPFHMARASNRLTSVQINTTKQVLVVMSCSVFTVPPGAHVCLKSANVFTRAVVDSRSLSTANETCNEDKGNCTKNVGAHLGSTPEHLIRVYTCSPRLRRPLVNIVPFCGVWWASVNYRSLRSWPLLSPPGQRYSLTFTLGVLRAVRCTWAQWQWKLVHSPYQHPSRTKSSKVSPCLSWIQLLFTDTLTSTLHDWLS